MKNYKTKWAIFRLFLVTLVGLAVLFGHQQFVSAATDPLAAEKAQATQSSALAKQCFDGLKFTDAANITCTITGYPTTTTTKTYTFVDNKPISDTIENYAPTNLTTSDLLCKVTSAFSNSYAGINLKSSILPEKIGAATSIKADFNLGIMLPNALFSTPGFGGGSGLGCYPYGYYEDTTRSGKILEASAGSAQSAKIWFSWDKATNTINGLSGITAGDLNLGSAIFSENPKHDPPSKSNIVIYESKLNLLQDTCAGQIIAVQLNGTGAPDQPTLAKEFSLDSSYPNKLTATTFPELSWFDSTVVGASLCGVKANFGSGSSDWFNINKEPPTAEQIKTATGSTTGTGGSSSGGTTGTSVCGNLTECLKQGQNIDSNACATNSHTSMEWILCPIVNSISNFADVINGYIEDQLHFRVDSMLPDGGGINQAWSIVKNIVASLLVIIMLVMVISQAIGRGPFEAYTVKKILPRLVIAVIVMQFSWVLTKELINIANDLGMGIIQIMTAPFGGPNHLDLGSILHNLDGAWVAGVQVPILGVMLALILTPASTFILPIVLFIALAVGSALFVAMVTLVFRNILLIMSVLFSPLALLFWILPGQTFQGYWKKFLDNFIKLLMLFPLVMGMIYAGRIVASLAGNIGKPGPIDYIVVMIAFFGPYFYLPKAFKWGGSILAGVNQAINTNKGLNATTGWLNRRIKAETARRSGMLGKNWNEQDKYLRFGNRKMPVNRLWQKGGKYNPLTRATTKMALSNTSKGGLRFNKNTGTGAGNLKKGSWVQKRVGRKLPQLQGRKIYGLAGGAFFDKGLSNEGMLARSEHEKETLDKAAAVRAQRAKEGGRDRKVATRSYFRDDDGKTKAKTIPKGKGPFSPTSAAYAKIALLNSPHAREAEQVAKELVDGSDPDMGTHLGNRLLFDPKDYVGERTGNLKNKYNVRGDFEEGKETPEDITNMRDMNSLKKRHARAQELQAKVTSGMASAAEIAELARVRLGIDARGVNEHQKMRELQWLYDDEVGGGFHKANIGRMDQAHRDAHAVNLATAEETAPWALEAPSSDSVLSDLNSTLPENEQLKLIPVLLHPKLQKKVAGSGALGQALGAINPQALGIIHEKFKNAGYTYGKQYDLADMIRYIYSDHISAQREGSKTEASEKNDVVEYMLMKEKGMIGKMMTNQYGNPSLLPGDERLRLYEEHIDLLDSNTLAILGYKMWTESTRIPFEGTFGEGGLNAADFLGDTVDIGGNKITDRRVIMNLRGLAGKPRDDHDRLIWANAAREIQRIRTKIGIPVNDARKVTARDLVAYAEYASSRRYYPDLKIDDFLTKYYSRLPASEQPQEILVASDKDAFNERLRTAGMDDFIYDDTAPPAPPPSGGAGTAPRPGPGMPGGPVFMPEAFEGQSESRQPVGNAPAGTPAPKTAFTTRYEQLISEGVDASTAYDSARAYSAVQTAAAHSAVATAESPVNPEISQSIAQTQDKIGQLWAQISTSTDEAEKDAIYSQIEAARNAIRGLGEQASAEIAASANIDLEAMVPTSAVAQAMAVNPQQNPVAVAAAAQLPATINLSNTTGAAPITNVTQEITNISQPERVIAQAPVTDTSEGSTGTLHSPQNTTPTSGGMDWRRQEDDAQLVAHEIGKQVQKGFRQVEKAVEQGQKVNSPEAVKTIEGGVVDALKIKH